MDKKLNWLAVVLLLCVAETAGAHKMSEIYIPIGQSPGLSGKQTLVGNIVSVDAAAMTIEVRGPEGARTVNVDGATYIWLDRSGLRRKNTEGGYEDCAPGSRVEVKFKDPDQRTTAEWIKVEIKN